MAASNEVIGKPRIVRKIEQISWLFFWLDWFYPKARCLERAYLLNRFFAQKILRINGNIPWPVHPTSRVLYYKNIKVGNRSFPGNNIGCYIQGRSGIIIGNNCRFGPGVGLISSNHSLNNYDVWDKTDSIIIGNNVWLGMNVVVMPSVSIGDNVIIGANSVVTKDIPSNSIAVGNPCRVIKEKGPYKGEAYEKAC